MRIYADNDMDAPGMGSAKAGLDALVKELETPQVSKVIGVAASGVRGCGACCVKRRAGTEHPGRPFR